MTVIICNLVSMNVCMNKRTVIELCDFVCVCAVLFAALD